MDQRAYCLTLGWLYIIGRAVRACEKKISSIKCHMSGTFEKRKENHDCRWCAVINKLHIRRRLLLLRPAIQHQHQPSSSCIYLSRRYINSMNFSIRNDTSIRRSWTTTDVPAASHHYISNFSPSSLCGPLDRANGR